jgi:hypothetical protein
MPVWNRRPIRVLIRDSVQVWCRPAMRRRSLGQLLLQRREERLIELGPGQRRLRRQGPLSTLLPGPAPPLGKPHADT